MLGWKAHSSACDNAPGARRDLDTYQHWKGLMLLAELSLFERPDCCCWSLLYSVIYSPLLSRLTALLSHVVLNRLFSAANTSTETVRTIRDGHLDFHTAIELCGF